MSGQFMISYTPVMLMLLGAFHLLILGRFYLNPITMARSELLSTFFPTWLWQGREWLKGKIPKYDPYFWINAHAHPVISTYYPPGIISSIIGASLDLDAAFKVLVVSLGLHFLFASFGWYFLCLHFAPPLIAAFAGITLTYNGYQLKQQPCLVYTISWFPWMLLGVVTNNFWLTAIAVGYTILSGYYPIGIQTLLIAIAVSAYTDSTRLWAVSMGFLFGAPQLLCFLKYLPKTIRAHKHDDLGTVPWWHFISLIFPKSFRYSVGGVGFWEMSYYIGLVALGCTFFASWPWILVLWSALLMMGVGAAYFPRIPARWAFSFSFWLSVCAVQGLARINPSNSLLWALLFVQAFDLYWNSIDLIPPAGYSELPNRPSRIFDTPLTNFLSGCKERVSGLPYPLFTGHVNKIRTLGYSGGMQLKLMAKFRNDKNSNGSGEHDWFRSHNDWPGNYRVRFAFSRKKLDSAYSTPIRFLYENPSERCG